MLRCSRRSHGPIGGSKFSTLGDRLDDFGREKRQSDEAGNVAINYTFAAGDRGQRSRPGGNEFCSPEIAATARLGGGERGILNLRDPSFCGRSAV
jgi:hypothetical protein